MNKIKILTCGKLAALIVAASAAISMAVNADTIETNGVTWTYSVNNATAKTVTLGNGSTACIPTDATVDATNIPWTFMKDGERYTVTALAASAFAYCTNMTGTLTIPMAVTSWGGSCFRTCKGLTRVTSLGGYTGTGNVQGMFRECTGLTGVLVIPDEFSGGFGNYSFDACTNLTGIIVGSGTKQCNTCFASKKCTGSYAISSYTVSKLKGVWYKGRPDVTTGTQDYTKIIPGDQLREEIALKVVLIGKNTQPSGTAGDMMVNVSGCKVFIPQNGKWIPGTTYANANNEVIWYGANTNLDLSVNTDLMQITAIPKTADMLVKVLEAAPIFKDVFGLEPRISVTNAIDLTGVTITPAMMSGVTFDRLMFSAKTQAQLNAILGAFPTTTPISIDPTGLTENMVIPETYNNVHVKTVPGVTIKRTARGLMLIVK